MTTIRSATSIASSWSWVTKTLVTFISSCSRRSQRRSSFRTRASSAPNGSSSSSTLGSTASARARAMRWRWPPESWCGKRSAIQSSWTSFSSSVTLARICASLGPAGARPHPQAEGDVLEDRHVAEQRVVLEDEADAALAHVDIGGVFAVEQDRAGIGHLEAGDDAQQGRLARARRAEQRHQLARRHVEVQVVADDRRAEALVEATHLDAHAAPAPAAFVTARPAEGPLAAPGSAPALVLTWRSTKYLSASVTSASPASSDATANAAANWYSL